MIADVTIDDLVMLKEAGEGRSDLDRAQLLLAWGYPEYSWSELANLPLGERDRLLLELRRTFFGPDLTLSTTCTNCQAKNEFAVAIPEIVSAQIQRTKTEMSLTMGNWALHVRPLSALDLSEVPDSMAEEDVRHYMATKCLVLVHNDQGENQEIMALSQRHPDWIDQLSDFLALEDPLYAVAFKLTCPDCGSVWQAFLEITQILWQEMTVEHDLMLKEIHLLAQHYGWCETDIIALSSVRRRAYAQQLVQHHV
ncbi:hypothetical protein [Sneathiella sp.]|jgi:hypothetical protein|uniref:T4 family baseplate hub assembly chaperone n=1 Tax=Sneathiella sp. TaxID=1964365 RepID=UPI0039E6E7D1